MEWINQIHIGDSLNILKQMPDNFIHCTVTSPPYCGLRDYGVPGQLGLEKTPEEYMAKMVEVFREVKRVLRKDGTLWLNLGDSYAGSQCGSNDYRPEGSSISKSDKKYRGQKPGLPNGLKPKDLIGIPWRVALALQADGWYLRSDIIWAKPNPMPESVTDRPTKAHEYIFLLSKSAKYYFDQDAVKENPQRVSKVNWKDSDLKKYSCDERLEKQGSYKDWRKYCPTGEVSSRNIRTVWTISTQPYKEAHFATFPEEIPERCIKAGTSERGCCPKCGGLWMRVVKKKSSTMNIRVRDVKTEKQKHPVYLHASQDEINNYSKEEMGESKTIGWQPSCSCGEEPVPCVCLDPFMGSGTVAKVAIRLRRNWIGIELKPEYVEMVNKRIAGTQINLIDF